MMESEGKQTKKLNKIIVFSVIGIVIVALSAAIVVVLNSNSDKKETPTVTVDDLTDEQKKKLGVDSKEKESKKTPETEDKNSYTEEYKQYLELSDEEKEKVEVVPRKQTIPDEKIEDIKEDIEENGGNTIALPERFDLRDVIDITVGNQGGHNICWTYASSTALETYLKLRGINYNPSEFQIDFLSSDLMYGDRALHEGGFFWRYASVASTIGTISEEKFLSLGIDPDGSYGSGSNNYDYFKLAKNDNPIYVTKVADFPSVNKEYGMPINKTEEELNEFRALVKKHIMTNGALYATTSLPWPFGLPRYCEKSTSACKMDHAIAIIGWDDTYSKENFGKVNENGDRVEGTPVHDGAYIALNSYGKDWSGSDAKNGVYYISYDEYGIEPEMSGIASTSFDDAKKIESISSQVVKDVIKEKLSFNIIKNNGEEYITNYALDKVTSLDLSSRGLTDNDLLNIADVFHNLTSLTIDNNNISNLSPISNLKYLSNLSFSHNNVTDITPLCRKNALYYLNLSYNNIPDISCLGEYLEGSVSIDVSGNIGIAGLEKLKNVFSLSANEIGLQSLEQLGSINNLSQLSVRNNNLKNLDGLKTSEESFYGIDLSGNKGLVSINYDKPIYHLSINDIGLTDISILNNVNATIVVATGNNFGDLSGFHNDKIMNLNLSGNKNLSNFASLNTVSILTLSDCNISSLATINGLDNVESLTLSNNKITSLSDIGKFKNLTGLTVDNNQISSLNGVSSLTKLTSFSADGNKISNADELLNLENLYFVSLNDNKLTAVPNFKKQSDVHLALSANPIKNVVIPETIASINLKDCGVKTVNYSAAKRLMDINLEGNPGWNEYRNLISTVINNQKSTGLSYVSIYVRTDYNFSKQNLDDFNEIPGTTDKDHWSMSISELRYNLKKSKDGTINLEEYPNERSAIMSLLGSNADFRGVAVDQAASKIIITDSSVEQLAFDYYKNVNNNTHITASKIVFNLSA